MAVNNNGNLLDTSGNVFVDYVWGNFAPQPNDERTDGTAVEVVANNAAQNKSWSGYSVKPSARLNPALGNHADIESDWSGFPAFVENSAGKKASGVYYIQVPNVLGLTTALALDALKDAGYETANITTASGATNTATQPTGINVTTTTAATVTIAGGTSTWPVGTKVTIASGTGIPTALVGTWSVTGGSGSTLVIAGSGWTVANTGAITPGTALTGAAGTVKTQSTAANASTILTSATITVTPWAASA
jgi:hypothetical protein